MKIEKVPAPYEVIITLSSKEAQQMSTDLYKEVPLRYLQTEGNSYDRPLGDLLQKLRSL